jgi:hypothetical protein
VYYEDFYKDSAGDFGFWLERRGFIFIGFCRGCYQTEIERPGRQVSKSGGTQTCGEYP